MATQMELYEALQDYTERSRLSERVKRTLANWNCVLHIQATDLTAEFTCIIQNGEFTSIDFGLNEIPDLIVKGNSEDLANIFWGDENPVSNYMQGAIQTRGSQEDVLRLDAMALFIYLELGGA
ncbi:SCP2 sterol-binding domain-containing protein [Bacillus sp. AFS029533]|uniref:SCP2 sterol-binding domain-containing protein n=1 Tax=Bacillus sp. AFS029533 TaxID=2033494 RepID=UPI000BFDEC9D|nr:SCP2 sterol-binding domain-containing protein [Bacillus sp. AFS029533]PGZ92277.1 hypothetical protein COE53_13015 [Bacillus sp. AFS029533]